MVAYKASQMGLMLASNEIEVIASHVNTTASSFVQTLDDIESALNNYVDYQKSEQSKQIVDMVDRVSNRANQKDIYVGQKLATELKGLSTALEVAEQQRKTELSDFTAAIKERLKIPVNNHKSQTV